MATATRKVTLNASRDIPFNKLVLSQSNVRRVKAGISIEQLAEDIAHRSLLQSLNVRDLDRLEQEYANADELPEEVSQRLSEFETSLEVLERACASASTATGIS